MRFSPLLPTLLATLLIFAPRLAMAQDVEFIYNTNAKWAKQETDAAWSELQQADASKTKEERCYHANNALGHYNSAADITYKLVNSLATAGDEDAYKQAKELYEATESVYKQMEQMYLQQCVN